jgi:hypothetical protein
LIHTFTRLLFSHVLIISRIVFNVSLSHSFTHIDYGKPFAVQSWFNDEVKKFRRTPTLSAKISTCFGGSYLVSTRGYHELPLRSRKIHAVEIYACFPWALLSFRTAIQQGTPGIGAEINREKKQGHVFHIKARQCNGVLFCYGCSGGGGGGGGGGSEGGVTAMAVAEKFKRAKNLPEVGKIFDM